MINLSLNSQAIILLTAYFNSGDQPLTISEYTKFANWLAANNLQPSMLINNDVKENLKQWQDSKISVERLLKLLGRGSAMGIVLEKYQRSGLWIITRADAEYPVKLKKILGQKSPPILYGSGDRNLLNTRGVAIVGSRNANPEDLEFSRNLGAKLANCGYSVISGAAKGVDEYSMLGSIDSDGTTIGVVADSLLQKTLSAKYRNALRENRLVLISPFNPEARFNVGNAMSRNKYIYVLSESAVVVHSGNSGGTWNGALENIKNNWVKLFIKKNLDPNSGNDELIKNGGVILPIDILQRETVDCLLEEQNIIKQEISTIKQPIESTKSLANQILELLEHQELNVKDLAIKLQVAENVIKIEIKTLIKSQKIEKTKSRPLKYIKTNSICELFDELI